MQAQALWLHTHTHAYTRTPLPSPAQLLSFMQRKLRDCGSDVVLRRPRQREGSGQGEGGDQEEAGMVDVTLAGGRA